MIKKITLIFMSLIILFTTLTTVSYAEAVPVTEENLNAALQSFIASGDGEFQISVENEIITIKEESGEYILNYDLTGKPTFWYETTIEEGMDYADFEKETGNLGLPMLGYIAVANIQGIEVNDSMSYLIFSALGGVLDGSFSTDDSYVIVDDLNVSDGVTIEKTDDPKVIYTSEFGERVMEYVNYMYKETQTVTDADGINSYTYTTEKKDVTEKSCKLVATLEMNMEADYSQLDGYVWNIGGENEDILESMKDAEKKTFNAKFEKYKGNQKGTVVEVLIREVESVNTDDSLRNVKISVSASEIEDTATYNVECKYDEEGYVNEILIKKVINNPEREEQDEEKPGGQETPKGESNKKDPTIANTYIPKAGQSYLMIGIIFTLIICTIIAKKKVEKYKDI